jgi:hypothetical protein
LPQTSFWHVAEHPSPGLVFPSSHCSPAVTFNVLSPQDTAVQSTSHVADSPLSSQASPAVALAVPSPQLTAVQSASQVADSPESSQASPGSTTPLPHPSFWHVAEHPSPGLVFPSSHCSPVVAF